MSGSWKRAYAPRGHWAAGDGLPSCMGAKSTRQDTIRPIDVFTKTNEIENLDQLLIRCDLAVATTILPLADLVVIAGWLHPFPFRTRP